MSFFTDLKYRFVGGIVIKRIKSNAKNTKKFFDIKWLLGFLYFWFRNKKKETTKPKTVVNRTNARRKGSLTKKNKG